MHKGEKLKDLDLQINKIYRVTVSHQLHKQHPTAPKAHLEQIFQMLEVLEQ